MPASLVKASGCEGFHSVKQKSGRWCRKEDESKHVEVNILWKGWKILQLIAFCKAEQRAFRLSNGKGLPWLGRHHYHWKTQNVVFHRPKLLWVFTEPDWLHDGFAQSWKLQWFILIEIDRHTSFSFPPSRVSVSTTSQGPVKSQRNHPYGIPCHYWGRVDIITMSFIITCDHIPPRQFD